MSIKSGRNSIGGGLALAMIAALGACGDGDSGTPTGGVSVTPTPTPTPTPTDPATAANQVVQQFLALDLAALDNYANPVFPAYYDGTVDAIDNTPVNDPVNDAVATLGRVMFYDAALSFNDTTSCSTCHKQSIGFDDDEQRSTGLNGDQTAQHAMRLGNVRYYEPGEMFWNRRAVDLEDQAIQPILDETEMGWVNNGGTAALITKIEGLAYYPALFEFVYGDPAITDARIEQSLAHFQRAMISSDSRWDRAYADVFGVGAPNRALNQALPGFSASENRGRELFMTGRNAGGAGCLTCHVPPTFTLTQNSRSNGLDAGETTVFKSPSLKNVGRSTFFMHDGRFTSLRQVVDHYADGVQAGPALDNRLQQGNTPLRLNLSEADREALVDFMLTLSDETLEADPKFADPFLP